MTSRHRLRQLDLSAIAEGCRQESQRFRAGQPGDEGHCFEMFRRAIEVDDQRAWSAVHTQYYRLVAQWIGSHRENDDLVESAFTKFWRTLNGVPLSRRFKHIGAVLAYLRKCAFSVRLDLERRERRWQREIPLDETIGTGAPAMDDLALQNVAREERRAGVRRWLEQNLSDPQEQLVVYLSYELDLPPAEIARRCPEQFPDVKTVRRIKERVLKRLRRADELRNLFES